MARNATIVFDGTVSFGGVSIGETTARLGIVLDRNVLDLDQADSLFCNRRLVGKVVLGDRDEGSNQRKLIDDVDHVVAGSFDVKGFRCSTECVSIGATFSLKDIDIAELARFSKGSGRMVVTEIGAIPEEPKEKKSAAAGVPGTLKADGPWKDHPLDELFDPDKTIRKALANADINTVGELADYTADKPLTFIDGIGPGKAQEIEDVMLEFWAKNPNAENSELAAAH